MNRTWSYRLNVFLFLLPALLLFCTILIAPIFLSVRDSMYSFSNFTGADRVFVAFGENDNYLTLFSRYLKDGSTLNRVFRSSVSSTLRSAVFRRLTRLSGICESWTAVPFCAAQAAA